MADTNPLDELMSSGPTDVPLGPVGQGLPPPDRHDTAMEVDQFGMHRAERLHAEANDPFGVSEGDNFIVSFGLDVDELADGMAACFEPRPEARPVKEVTCPVRQSWFERLLETPDYRNLHNQTMCDAQLSEIGAACILNQWKQHEAKSTDAQTDLEKLVSEIGSTQRACKQAVQDVTDAKAACAAFGLETGDNAGTDPQAVLKMFRELRDNPTLRSIAEWAGRFRRLASGLQRSKTIHGADDMVGVCLDNDVTRLLTGELASLCMPETELETLSRFVEKQTMCRDYRATESLGRGPIMVMVDESSSMNGDRIAKAKGLALSLVWLAEHQKRWVSLVGWSSEDQIRTVTFQPGQVDHAELMEWCATQWGGGTHPPLYEADKLFKEAGAPEGKTDVIWITDGECCLAEYDVQRYLAFKQRSQAKVWTIGIGTTGESFKPICDVVASIDTLGCDTQIVRDVLSI